MGQPALQQLVSDDGSGLTDDAILPAQFFDALADPRCEPEKRLMVAVLEEAISSLLHGQAGSDERRAVAREADRWFASDDCRAPFAFGTICDILDLDIGRVRHALAGWLERRRTFQRPRLQAGRGRHQVQRTGRRRSHRAA
ncbi:MAG: hypothetical protein ABI629_15740 [bacterium]